MNMYSKLGIWLSRAMASCRDPPDILFRSDLNDQRDYPSCSEIVIILVLFKIAILAVKMGDHSG